MGKIPRNQGKDWTRQEVKALRQLAKENTPTLVIGPEAGTNSGFNSQHQREGISLKPTNQSPYNRRK
jgi:hypothetical protein